MMLDNSNLIFTFDIGNTNPHIGIFEDHKLKEVLSLVDFLKSSYLKHQKGLLLISSVRHNHHFFDYPKEKTFLMSDIRKENYFLNMKIDYSKNLGTDRMLTSFLAFEILRQEKIQKGWVIDAGTFITCDLVDNPQGFMGGYILPGFNSLLSLSQKGENLPTLNQSTLENFIEYKNLPNDTPLALYNAIIMMFKGFFREVIKQPDLIILTGSGAHLIQKIITDMGWQIKSITDQHFIHKSMLEAHKHFLIC